jgi:hypothetical protein
MKKLALKSLGRKSPNFDLNAAGLDFNDVTYAKNYILRDDKYISFNNEESNSVGGSAVTSGYVDTVQTDTETYYLVAGLNAVKVYQLSTLTWSDISNVAAYGMSADEELTWTGCKLGRIPVITNSVGFPEYWSPLNTAQKMQDLKFDATTTWRSKGYKCKVIRSHLNFLFALNLTEGSTALPSAYRWSHPADVNGLPFSWDELDLSTIASKEMIDEEFIIDGLSLRNEFCIYTNRGIHLLSYTGRSDIPFERRILSKTNNYLAIDSIAEVLGSHYILMNGDIFINDGNNIRSILHKQQKRLLESTISSDNFRNSFVKYNPLTKEIWFFIVQQGFKYPNIAFIINHVDNTISIRDIAESKAHATFGPLQPTAAIWNSDTSSWDSDGADWDSSTSTGRIIALDSVGTLRNLEPISQSGIGNYNTVIERTNLMLEDNDNVSTITRVWPNIKSSGSVLIEVGSHDFVGSSIRWKPGVIYNPNYSRKVDIRTTGPLHSWRVSSINDSYFELNGLMFEFEDSGSRIGGSVPVISTDQINFLVDQANNNLVDFFDNYIIGV